MTHNLIITSVLNNLQKGNPDIMKKRSNRPYIFQPPDITSSADVKLIEDVSPKLNVPTKHVPMAPVAVVLRPNLYDKQKGKLSLSVKN